jgi:hypothetical protein
MLSGFFATEHPRFGNSNNQFPNHKEESKTNNQNGKKFSRQDAKLAKKDHIILGSKQSSEDFLRALCVLRERRLLFILLFPTCPGLSGLVRITI